MTGKNLVVSTLFLILILPFFSGVFGADNTVNNNTDEIGDDAATTGIMIQELSENPVVGNVSDVNKKVINQVSNQPIVQQTYNTITPYVQPAVSNANLYLSFAQQQGILFANMVNNQQQSFMISQAATVESVQQIFGF
ncbi:RebB family R body protein [Methanobacterium petrolearium]|uniref:RebB family R body protein n=1 Tax=Methanobacterium petrolearium TaxID=710190 RepID=UPI001AE3E5F9|nr:RebB family R body protein [Methanobacterium petrolearium]MBP1946302.1 hypothetical protein [Methanobacterium petrolearium]BDZ71400.1 hypothetical protein GCM10025861_19170 [Methanobacterium petrolearium]